MEPKYRKTQRIIFLKKQINDPTYIDKAISEMAQQLALELFPRLYTFQANLLQPDSAEQEQYPLQ